MLKEVLKSLPSLKEVVEKYGLLTDKRHSKSLGQNFLLDLNITRKVAGFAGSLTGFDVLEVGPGVGGLTRAILEKEPRHLYAIERDKQCVEALQPLVSAFNGRLTVIQNDAQRITPQDLTNNPIKIIANLPYNVGTNLLLQWLSNLNGIHSFTLMFQKEVALRIAASPGNKDYGRLSVISQYLCSVEHMMDLPPHVFTPAPKVFSSVVNLTPKSLSQEDLKLVPYIEKITQAVFSQRRKMIRASLRSLFDETRLAQVFESLNIPPTERPENLNLQNFVDLAQHFKRQLNEVV